MFNVTLKNDNSRVATLTTFVTLLTIDNKVFQFLTLSCPFSHAHVHVHPAHSPSSYKKKIY